MTNDFDEQTRALVVRQGAILADAAELLQHAIAMGHFTPGGSTLGWAEEVLARIQSIKRDTTYGSAAHVALDDAFKK
jgi:hypothetical protein